MTVSPTAQRPGFYFATVVDGSFPAEKVVAFLRDLLRHLPGEVVVIWDGGGNHKGAVIRELLRWNKRLRPVRLPAYAPDRNPVEAVWSWLKWGRVANDVPDARLWPCSGLDRQLPAGRVWKTGRSAVARDR